MYRLIKHIIKKPKKVDKLYGEMTKVRLNQNDFTLRGLQKLKEALREVSGDPDLDLDTITLDVPIKGFDYEDNFEEKVWEWEE